MAVPWRKPRVLKQEARPPNQEKRPNGLTGAGHRPLPAGDGAALPLGKLKGRHRDVEADDAAAGGQSNGKVGGRPKPTDEN
jgi:hypothetical protein